MTTSNNHGRRLRNNTLLLVIISVLPITLSFSTMRRPRAILCCSSEQQTAAVLQTVFENVHHVASVEDAKTTLALAQQQQQQNTLFTAVVVDETTWNDHGDLISYCARKGLGPVRLVFSTTFADDDDDAEQQCYGSGADVVVSTTVEELKRVHDVLIHDDSSCSQGTDDLLQRRYQRQATLQELAGGALTHRVQQLHSHSNRLQQQMDEIQKFRQGDALLQRRRYERETATLLQEQLSDSGGGGALPQLVQQVQIEDEIQTSIKVVHISDTHNLHRNLRLPEGDLLLHTGDIVANYREKYEIDLLQQFTDFLDWIAQEACPKYEKIVFLAGNHDTYLDPIKAKPEQYEQSMTILKDFLAQNPKVSYLYKSSVVYRGLSIYGTPTTICRVEAHERTMLSNGFERKMEERYQDWENISECDILLTHLPPAGLGLADSHHSCPMLTNAVYYRTRKTPRLHAFGHVHSQFGVAQQDSTILSNASQERILRVDLYGGGAPIVLDLAV